MRAEKPAKAAWRIEVMLARIECRRRGSLAPRLTVFGQRVVPGARPTPSKAVIRTRNLLQYSIVDSLTSHRDEASCDADAKRKNKAETLQAALHLVAPKALSACRFAGLYYTFIIYHAGLSP